MSAVGAYLAKKQWNPGNKKNVEEVWKKEQAKKSEDKKLQELREEYEQERSREQLDELQVQAGVKKSATRLEWMYEGAPADGGGDKSGDEEAFLLGTKSIDGLVQQPKVDLSRRAALASAPASAPSSSFSANELFVRRHEDPLAYVQQHTETKRQREELKDKHARKKHRRDSKEEGSSKKEKKHRKKS
ncbi:hypothetical protein BASA81_001558 [Batrachochytrium salamandrivorans]|nr:hypothetical protein BASA81_001558 [Batrachochytrium salamandrivorans]